MNPLAQFTFSFNSHCLDFFFFLQRTPSVYWSCIGNRHFSDRADHKCGARPIVSARKTTEGSRCVILSGLYVSLSHSLSLSLSLSPLSQRTSCTTYTTLYFWSKRKVKTVKKMTLLKKPQWFTLAPFPYKGGWRNFHVLVPCLQSSISTLSFSFLALFFCYAVQFALVSMITTTNAKWSLNRRDNNSSNDTRRCWYYTIFIDGKTNPVVKVGSWTLRRLGVQHHRQSVAIWRWCWTLKRLKVQLPTFTTGFVFPSIKIV